MIEVNILPGRFQLCQICLPIKPIDFFNCIKGSLNSDDTLSLQLLKTDKFIHLLFLNNKQHLIYYHAFILNYSLIGC